MSQENVEAFKRVTEARNRRDIESLLERYDPDVEARYAPESLLGGKAVVHRGHEGVREAFRAYSDTMASFITSFPSSATSAIGSSRSAASAPAGGRAASRPSPRSPYGGGGLRHPRPMR